MGIGNVCILQFFLVTLYDLYLFVDGYFVVVVRVYTYCFMLEKMVNKMSSHHEYSIADHLSIFKWFLSLNLSLFSHSLPHTLARSLAHSLALLIVIPFYYHRHKLSFQFNVYNNTYHSVFVDNFEQLYYNFYCTHGGIFSICSSIRC